MGKIYNWDQFNMSEAISNTTLTPEILSKRGKAYHALYSVDMEDKDRDYVKDQLSNSEESSDEELVDLFTENISNLSKADAKKLITARDYFAGMDDLKVVKFLSAISTDTATIDKIAKEFSSLLAKEIGIDKMKDVKKLNIDDTNKDVCHSHDFCDANMVMQDAFKVVGIDLEKDFPDAVQNEFITDTWEKAWTLAKKNNFYVNDKGEIVKNLLATPIELGIKKTNLKGKR